MRSLIGDGLIRFYLGIWDDKDRNQKQDYDQDRENDRDRQLNQSTDKNNENQGNSNDSERIAEWADTVFAHQISHENAEDLFNILKPDLDLLYQRYTQWMAEMSNKSRVKFGPYYAMKMTEALEKKEDPDVEDFRHKFTDEEFRELEKKAAEYLAAKGEQPYLDEGVIVLGDHLTSFVFFLLYQIDEISMRINEVLFSRDRLFDEKIADGARLNFVKYILKSVLRRYCSTWEMYREMSSAYEFELGYFNNRFYMSGGVIDMCSSESGLSLYSDNLLDFFMTRDEKMLTDELAGKAYDLRDKANRKLDEFREQESKLRDVARVIPLESYEMKTYVPFARAVKDEQLLSIEDNEAAELCYDLMEVQELIPVIDLMLNILKSRDTDPQITSFTDEEIDDLYDELEFSRNEAIRIVYANARKARRLTSNYSIEQIELSEKHILDIWKMLDALELLIESTTIENIEQYMKLKKTINERAEGIDDDTLISARFEHIVALMGRRIEELTAQGNAAQLLADELEGRVGSFDKVCKDFMIPLAGGEQLYDRYIVKAPASSEFDYSCIAIMYYTALETLLTRYLYIDYLKKCGLYTNGGTSYMDIEDARELRDKYFSKKFRLQETPDHKKAKFPDFCELGSFKFIYTKKAIKDSQYLREYLEKDLGVADTDDIVKYCEDVYDLRTGRNHAAHGMHIVTYDETKSAKKSTFIEHADTLHGMIIEFLNLINI